MPVLPGNIGENLVETLTEEKRRPPDVSIQAPLLHNLSVAGFRIEHGVQESFLLFSSMRIYIYPILYIGKFFMLKIQNIICVEKCLQIDQSIF